MKTRAYFTIEYIPEGPEDPEIEPAVIEFDEVSFSQERAVRREEDAAGNFVRFVPDATWHTVIRGTVVEKQPTFKAVEILVGDEKVGVARVVGEDSSPDDLVITASMVTLDANKLPGLHRDGPVRDQDIQWVFTVNGHEGMTIRSYRAGSMRGCDTHVLKDVVFRRVVGVG
jgi:hypothetical protein